jgi:hypothetical protein
MQVKPMTMVDELSPSGWFQNEIADHNSRESLGETEECHIYSDTRV